MRGDVGHGKTGLLDNLRLIGDLSSESSSNRRPYLDIGFGTDAFTWVLHSGSIWKTTANYMYDGVLRDVIAVETLVGNLTRVETLAQMVAGTYYYNVESAVSAITPWDFDPDFDDGSFWDSGGVDGVLYVWMPANADPRPIPIIACLGFYYSTVTDVQPSLGADLLAGAGAGESLTGWTVTTSNATLDIDADTFKDGTGSFRGSFDGVAASGFAQIDSTAVPTVAGETYRVSGYYRTVAGVGGTPGTMNAQIAISSGANYVHANGRSYQGSPLFANMTETNGDWRRFIFDFVAFGSTTAIRLRIAGGAATGHTFVANFDTVVVSRVYRFNTYEPRLSSTSIGQFEVMSQDINFGPKSIGIGDLRLLNGDGLLTPIIAQLLSDDKPATLWIGGTFTDGQEIQRDDWTPAWPARIRGASLVDEEVTFQADDSRSVLMKTNVPVNQLTFDEYPNISLNNVNYSKPLHFDRWGAILGINAENIKFIPPRVDASPTTGYGTYLMFDASLVLGALGWIDVDNIAWAYASNFFMSRGTNPEPSQAALGIPYLTAPLIQAVFQGRAFGTFNELPVTVSITDNIVDHGPIDRTNPGYNLWFDFNIGGGNFIGMVAYPFSSELASNLQSYMRTVSGAADINVTYSSTTHKFTISKGAGVLNLLAKTGPFAQLGHYRRIGFTSSNDYTGLLSYTGEDVDFQNADNDHALICTCRGYRDDASGSLTGIANDYIDTRAGIAHFILRQVLKIPSDRVDAASFRAGHTAELATAVDTKYGQRLCCFLRLEESISAGDLLGNLSSGAFADLIIDPQGRWSWRMYSPSAAPAASFTDSDYLTWWMGRDPSSNVWARVKVTFGQHPARGTWESYQTAANVGIPLKYGVNRTLYVQDYSHPYNRAYARIIADRYARLGTQNPRVAVFSVATKMQSLVIGSIVLLSRTRALDASGSISNVRFRVLGIKSDLIENTATLTVIEDVPFWS